MHVNCTHLYVIKNILTLMIPCKFCQQTEGHSWQLGLCVQSPCGPGSPCLQLSAGRTPTEAEADLRVPALRACKAKITSNILLQTVHHDTDSGVARVQQLPGHLVGVSPPHSRGSRGMPPQKIFEI